MTHASHRGTIFLEEAEIIEHRAYEGAQYILRVRAPKAARTARPGSFAHLRCDAAVPLRRPLSIMRADPQAGCIEFLYKIVGHGLAALARQPVGAALSSLAPIGNGFAPRPDRPHVLAIGGGVGIPPVLFLAEALRGDERFVPYVLMGSEVPFPFELAESALDPGAVPRGATHGLALLERWGIASRLASNAGLAGAFVGYVTDLARTWLEAAPSGKLARVQIAACGPDAMLGAVARLAREFGVPCQLALEEYMACGVGGCAGCTVLVHTRDGPRMQRVCVDGPVFDAEAVFPA